MPALKRKFVVFTLEQEVFAVDILIVREVIVPLPVTPLPQVPDFVEGVINLRGQIIPVIDMRRRFGLEGAEHGRRERMVIVEFAGGSVALVVDAVRGVLELDAGEIQPPPARLAGVRTDLIRGAAHVGGEVVVMLDLEQILQAAEKIALQELRFRDLRTEE